jgi:hypothetical protein
MLASIVGRARRCGGAKRRAARDPKPRRDHRICRSVAFFWEKDSKRAGRSLETHQQIADQQWDGSNVTDSSCAQKGLSFSN